MCVNADSAPVEPALFVFSPLQPQDSEGTSADALGPDVCLATDFRPKENELVLNLRGGPLNMSTGGAAMSLTRKTYFYAGFINETIHSCELNNTAGNHDNRKKTFIINNNSFIRLWCWKSAGNVLWLLLTYFTSVLWGKNLLILTK